MDIINSLPIFLVTGVFLFMIDHLVIEFYMAKNA